MTFAVAAADNAYVSFSPTEEVPASSFLWDCRKYIQFHIAFRFTLHSLFLIQNKPMKQKQNPDNP